MLLTDFFIERGQMLTRRRLLIAAGVAAALPAMPSAAADERLLADILHGVTDVLIEDYIREKYGEGRWDGRYWWYDGHRYSPREYRIYWEEDYRRHPHWRPRHWKRDDDDDDDDDDEKRRRPRRKKKKDDDDDDD